MRIIKARYRTGADFVDACQPTSAGGGTLFLATREALQPDDEVVVEVSLPELPERVLLRGRVAWRHARRRVLRRRAGVGVALASSERAKRDFLIAVARGERPVSLVVPRRHRRLPVSVRVLWRTVTSRARARATLGDIAAGGAFLRTRDLQPAGTPLVIELVPPGGQAPLAIEGRVAWSRRDPGDEGLGVEFRCRDTGGLHRLKELVRRFERDGSPFAIV